MSLQMSVSPPPLPIKTSPTPSSFVHENSNTGKKTNSNITIKEMEEGDHHHNVILSPPATSPSRDGESALHAYLFDGDCHDFEDDCTLEMKESIYDESNKENHDENHCEKEGSLKLYTKQDHEKEEKEDRDENQDRHASLRSMPLNLSQTRIETNANTRANTNISINTKTQGLGFDDDNSISVASKIKTTAEIELTSPPLVNRDLSSQTQIALLQTENPDSDTLLLHSPPPPTPATHQTSSPRPSPHSILSTPQSFLLDRTKGLWSVSPIPHVQGGESICHTSPSPSSHSPDSNANDSADADVDVDATPTVTWYGYTDDADAESTTADLSFANRSADASAQLTFSLQQDESDAHAGEWSLNGTLTTKTTKEIAIPPLRSATLSTTFHPRSTSSSITFSGEPTISEAHLAVMIHGSSQNETAHAPEKKETTLTLRAILYPPPVVHASTPRLEWRVGGNKRMLRLRNAGNGVVVIRPSIRAVRVTDQDAGVDLDPKVTNHRFQLMGSDNFGDKKEKDDLVLLLRPQDRSGVWVNCKAGSSLATARLVLEVWPYIRKDGSRDSLCGIRIGAAPSFLEPRLYEVELKAGGQEMRFEGSEESSHN